MGMGVNGCLTVVCDLAHLRHRVKTSAPRKRGYAAAATRAEDGRFLFAFVVLRGMIASAAPVIDRACALAKKMLGAVPEVYGDDDNEKISQAHALVALGPVDPVHHPKVLDLRLTTDDELIERLAVIWTREKSHR